MVNSNKTAKSAIIIIIFTLGSKFLGFFREILIAAKFGSGMETDTFFIALSAAALIGSFLKNTINTTFIPVISEVESKEGKKGKIKHTNNMINVTLLVSIIIIIIAEIGAPLIVKLLASGFEGEQFNLAVKLTRIGLPIILFSGIIGVMTGYLQSETRFNATAIMGFPFNFIYIIYLLFFASIFGIRGLMVSSVIAIFSQLLIQIPEARISGFKYKLVLDFKDTYIRKVLYLSIPVFIGVAINDLNIIIDKTLASSLAPGSISALNYSNKLNGLILGVFISAITTVIFPLLSKQSNSGNITSMKNIMGRGINLLLLITVPATIGLIVLSIPIVQVAFERGEFDTIATQMTSRALIFYSIGLVPMAMKSLITRVYYSLQDTKTPMINGTISVVFNIILNIILVKYMGHAGLAFATSISTSIATLILLYGLKKKIGSLGTKSYLTTFFKTGLASGIMAVFAYFIYNGMYRRLNTWRTGNLISLLLAAGIGAILYVVLCYVFKVEEIRDLVNKIKGKLIR